MREWAFSVCVAVVAGCMARIIFPSGSTGKMINFSISMFLLSCLFSNVIIKDPELNISCDSQISMENTQERIEKIKKEKNIKIVESRVRNKLEKDLMLAGFIDVEILVNIRMNDESEILIHRIEIRLDKKYNKENEKIKSIVSKDYGIVPDISYK